MSVPSGAAPGAAHRRVPRPHRRSRRTAVAAVAVSALVSAALAIAPADASVPRSNSDRSPVTGQPGPKPALVEPDSAFQGQAPLEAPLAQRAVPAKYPQLAAKPYLGWSSWSLQSTNYPGVNPDGPGSFISEKNVLAQAQVMASKLKPFGYEYINVDAGWQNGGDEYGRPVANTARFPRGMKAIGDDLHKLGLKFGIYTVVGLGFDVYRDGNTPIHNAPGCFTRDIVYPDLRTTNGWDQAYKINYASPCAQKYADSIAKLFASWGVDFIKMDGVGPGSWKGAPDDPNHNNTADVEAWWRAVQNAGRPMLYTLSWSLSHRYAETWKANSHGWRIDTDVECYCDTIVRWNGSLVGRWWDLPQWVDDAGPGHWNNLDAINVGNGEMDGITEIERQSYMTFWAMNAAPLFIGDDLTKLDAYGMKLLTNREVIAINQAGVPARPLNQDQLQQVWHAKNPDGSVTVGLFNLADSPATVTGRFDQLGVTGQATVRDVWAAKNTAGVTGQVSAELPAHGSKLYKITPAKVASPGKPADLTATDADSTTVSLEWQPSTGATSYAVFANGRQVGTSSSTTVVAKGLQPQTEYTFTVKALHKGKTSEPSAPITLPTSKADGPVRYEAEAPTSTLTGNAGISDCSLCSGGKKIGNIGGDASVTLNGITVPTTGTYLVRIAYTDGDTSRQSMLTVNGQDSYWVNYHGLGDNDWGTPQVTYLPMKLQAGENSIKVHNPTGYIADIDWIAV
ncbi:fibronectin type III domain protein [Kribbella amoyensis]|uniref:Alpha-galactosidase n=1 Tax=Kribbella amoyensis TaxID=996641 RepID=A0A561BW52_9ACTN|nr:fibronectin type III domain-containing protein [Kribbella amoyensis]TWD83063.1 fibronectin type III domain protein [Kribbella amoyensis]